MNCKECLWLIGVSKKVEFLFYLKIGDSPLATGYSLMSVFLGSYNQIGI